MKISELYPKRYATGEDLKGPYTLTVRSVMMEEMHPQPGSPAVEKPVMYFEGAQKGIILSPALARQIAAILGDETEDWKGKRITLYPQPMTVAGKPRVAIRARAATNGSANGSNQPPAALVEDEEEL